MTEVFSLLEMQGMMFLLLLAGFIMARKGVLPESGEPLMTSLLVDFVLPCSIIHSFQVKFTAKVLAECAAVFAIATGIQIFAFAVSKGAYRRFPAARRGILEYGTICSNAGMMGSAIAGCVYGSAGMMYASIYLIPQRIAMWTAGLTCFEQAVSPKEMLRKVLVHPCIIAVEIGLVVMIGGISLPGFVTDMLDGAGSCTTPLSMIFIGMVLAKVKHLREMFDGQILFYTLIRLILFPAAVYVACRLCSPGPVVTGVSVLLSAMPAGSTVAVLASKYRQDADFSAKCVVVTTLLSLITVPFWCSLLALG